MFTFPRSLDTVRREIRTRPSKHHLMWEYNGLPYHYVWHIENRVTCWKQPHGARKLLRFEIKSHIIYSWHQCVSRSLRSENKRLKIKRCWVKLDCYFVCIFYINLNHEEKSVERLRKKAAYTTSVLHYGLGIRRVVNQAFGVSCLRLPTISSLFILLLLLSSDADRNFLSCVRAVIVTWLFLPFFYQFTTTARHREMKDPIDSCCSSLIFYLICFASHTMDCVIKWGLWYLPKLMMNILNQIPPFICALSERPMVLQFDWCTSSSIVLLKSKGELRGNQTKHNESPNVHIFLCTSYQKWTAFQYQLRPFGHFWPRPWFHAGKSVRDKPKASIA